jgi:HAD superfamily hydrolase (TIGR01509 family)
MKEAIEAVVFDFGNVLVRVDRSLICGRMARHCALSPQEVGSRLFDSDLEYDSETGKYDSREHFRRTKERIGAENGWTYEQFREEFKDAFELNPEGMAALEAASRRKRTFVLSNTSYLHALWLFEQEQLATIPEYHIFSFKVGAMKPDARIWEHMLRVSSLEARQCLYIDDMEEYCLVAGRLGFNSIHYQPGKTALLEELENWL